jgi:hypothetical protein
VHNVRVPNGWVKQPRMLAESKQPRSNFGTSELVCIPEVWNQGTTEVSEHAGMLDSADSWDKFPWGRWVIYNGKSVFNLSVIELDVESWCSPRIPRSRWHADSKSLARPILKLLEDSIRIYTALMGVLEVSPSSLTLIWNARQCHSLSEKFPSYQQDV